MRGSKAILRLSFTSALVLAVGACGKTNSLADAPGADSNRTDAANTIDADAHGPVTVITMNPDGTSGPLMGVPVVFQEPNGDLAAEVMTDATGKASADVLPGASVTAVYVISDTQHSLQTITGVKPNDMITIGGVYDNTADGSFTVNVIDVVGTQEYDVYGPCGMGSFVPVSGSGSGSGLWSPDGVVATDPVTIPVLKGCEESMMDLVAVRVVGGETTDYAELADVPYVATGSVTQTAAWTPVANETFAYSNVPVDVTSLGVEPNVPDYWGYYVDVTAPISGTTASTAAIMPLAKTGEVITTIDGTHNGEQQVIDVVDGTATAYTLDIGASLLPWIDAPTLDLTTGTITTPSTGSGGPGDAFEASVEFQRAAASGSGSGSATTTTYDWRVWAASVGDLTLPTLPTDLADNDPLATDVAGPTSSLVFDLDLATGYDAVRPYLSTVQFHYFNDHGLAGKLRTSYAINNGTTTRAPRGKRSLRALRQSPRIHVAHNTAAAR